jgi:hypothetical protein
MKALLVVSLVLVLLSLLFLYKRPSRFHQEFAKPTSCQDRPMCLRSISRGPTIPLRDSCEIRRWNWRGWREASRRMSLKSAMGPCRRI